MPFFILIFVCVYTIMHSLVFWGIYPVLKGHPPLPALTLILMGFMIMSPFLVRLLDPGEPGIWENAVRGLAWAGYAWMGLVFLAFSAFFIMGCWEFLVLILSKVTGKFIPCIGLLSLHGTISSAIVLCTVLGMFFYGFYEASHLKVEKVCIESSKLPSGYKKLVIVQVSDLHLGLIHREKSLMPVISKIQELNPDIIVATGDIVDAQINHIEGLSVLWRKLDPPLGKFAVTGNHEYYAGLKQSLDFLEKSGFTVLHNQSQVINQHLAVAGIDDPASRNPVDEVPILKALAESMDTPGFVLLLKHRPDFNKRAAGLFDLQLSGHTHQGQIFPFNLLTGLEYPMLGGLYVLSNGSRLYTSRGTGTWGPPMRIGSPPEITLFELVPEGQGNFQSLNKDG